MRIRDNKVILIVGRRKVGKSFLLQKLVEKYPGDKILIYDESYQQNWKSLPRISPENLCRWKKGIKKMYEPDTEYALQKINECLHNALVIFEDATKYIKSDSMKKLLTDCRHRNVDVILVFHSLNVIYPKIYEGADELLLFKTNDSEENLRSLNKIPQKDLILAGFRKVQSSENPHEVVFLKLK